SASSTTCTATVSLHSSLTITSGTMANIPGIAGSSKSVRLLSVTTTTAGKTFSKWTSGDNKADSGTDIPGTPTPCISTDAAGTNGNVTDEYAHFANSNLSTSTALSSSANPSTYPASVTFTAMVTP